MHQSPNRSSIALFSRRRLHRIGIVVCLGFLVSSSNIPFNPALPAISAAPPVERGAPPATQLGRLPLYFVENRGQANRNVSFYIQNHNQTVYFTPRGLTYVLTGENSGGERNTSLGDAASSRPKVRRSPARWAVRLDFVGANPGVIPEGSDQTETRISYLKGSPDQWQRGIQTYGSISYRDLWPGIDLIYSGSGGALKYTFVVKPGADPAQIRLAYRGATNVSLSETNQLKVDSPCGSLVDQPPVSYQETQGERASVATSYSLDGELERETFVYGFRVGNYDPTLPLIIDPVVLVYAGYIGGSEQDMGHGIAVDQAGNAYVVGETISGESTFPDGDGFGSLPGPDHSANGRSDAFVAKLNASGTALVYCTYVGGSGDDFGLGIAVNSLGEAYFVGEAASDQSSFPVVTGPDLTYNGGLFDAFVAKLNPAGTALEYCGYVGGSDTDRGYSIALDAAGNAYVCGTTVSTQATFPNGSGIGQLPGPSRVQNGGLDGFVAKINSSGTGFLYCGFIGGYSDDFALGIAVDAFGDAFVTGQTSSNEAGFPLVVGPLLLYAGGGTDGFIAKINPAGTAFVYCGYIGGEFDERGYGVAVDRAGFAYVAGTTTSTEATFPTGHGIGILPGPISFNSGNADAFIVRVSPSGSSFVYAGFIGGDGFDIGYAVTLDQRDNVYIAGTSNSESRTFPVVSGPGLILGGGSDAFVAKLPPNGKEFEYCGFIGGNNGDDGFGIAVDKLGNAYVTGRSSSSNATFPALRGPDLTFNGGPSDVLIAKVTTSRSGAVLTKNDGLIQRAGR
jgi:Beta-propeller repeat